MWCPSVFALSVSRGDASEEPGVDLIFLYHSLSAHWADDDIVAVPVYLTAGSCGRQKLTEN